MPSPSRAHQTKVSMLPFGPGSPDGAKPRTREAEAAGRLGDAEDRLAAVAGVADDAPADPLAAELELRLDHRQQLAARAEAGDRRRQHLGERDEGDVDRPRSRRRRAGRRGTCRGR